MTPSAGVTLTQTEEVSLDDSKEFGHVTTEDLELESRSGKM